jgi:hypothetical protein
MSCDCNYNILNQTSCKTCLNVANTISTTNITQRRIWNQVSVPSSMYSMNLSSFTSAKQRLSSQSTINWNQMSDRVFASEQSLVNHTHGNSLKSTLTSSRPGAASPGGKGVDVKHDSYARFLNRKKASNMKTHTTNIATTPLYGNKTKSISLISGSESCCS